MEQIGTSHIYGLFEKYNQTGLTEEEVSKVVANTLSLPWVKQMTVFADQFIVLLELKTFKYLHVSPSVEKITGYQPNHFIDASSFLALMPPGELEVYYSIANLVVSKFSELKLPPSQITNACFTWNTWYHRKDGSLINLLQRNIALLSTPEGMPLLQMSIATDITAFNSRREHFYKGVLNMEDGAEQILFSGRIENHEEPISPREQEVFKLVSRGQSSESIADQLRISVETVKAHRKHLLEKTKAKDTIDLVRYGYANGWL